MRNEFPRMFFGEAFGTFILVFFGCSAVAVSVLFESHIGLFQIAAIWGIAVSLAIYATRHLSCAHINPAVSIAMVVANRMYIKKLPIYLLAQLTGGFMAGLFVFLLFNQSIVNFELAHNIVRGEPGSVASAMIFGEYFPNPSSPGICSVSLFNAFLAETLGTFLLVSMIFLLTEGCNVGRPNSDFAPILIGATVTAIISILAPLTQAGINPARDFGPRLFSYLAGWKSIAIPGPKGGFFTVYVLGPIIGGVISALLFAKLIQPLMISKKRCQAHD